MKTVTLLIKNTPKNRGVVRRMISSAAKKEQRRLAGRGWHVEHGYIVVYTGYARVDRIVERKIIHAYFDGRLECDVRGDFPPPPFQVILWQAWHNYNGGGKDYGLLKVLPNGKTEYYTAYTWGPHYSPAGNGTYMPGGSTLDESIPLVEVYV